MCGTSRLVYGTIVELSDQILRAAFRLRTRGLDRPSGRQARLLRPGSYVPRETAKFPEATCGVSQHVGRSVDPISWRRRFWAELRKPQAARHVMGVVPAVHPIYPRPAPCVIDVVLSSSSAILPTNHCRSVFARAYAEVRFVVETNLMTRFVSSDEFKAAARLVGTAGREDRAP